MVATYRFKNVSFWKGAYHVYVGNERYGVVKGRELLQNGKTVIFWEAHNANMLPIEGIYHSRGEAAKAIPKPHSATKSKSITRGVG
jgi:hypothetical protein